MRRAQVLAVSVLLFALQVQAQPSKNPEVQKIADAFTAAWNKGDAKALAALHAEDAIRANPQGQVSVGRAAIEKTFAAALAGELKGTKLLVKSGDERTVTADLVVSSGTWEITGGTPPAGAATKGTYINTLVRQGGRWVILSADTDTDQVTPRLLATEGFLRLNLGSPIPLCPSFARVVRPQEHWPASRAGPEQHQSARERRASALGRSSQMQ